MNSLPTKTRGQATALTIIRRMLLVIFLLGALGTGAELWLLGHTEDRWQWVPLLLIATSLLVLLGHAAVRRAATLRVFQLVMILFLISGGVGIVLHYQGKVEFKREVNPELRGWELFWEAIKGAAVPPVLAPGIMVQLGLIGLAYAYRRPKSDAATEITINKGE